MKLSFTLKASSVTMSKLPTSITMHLPSCDVIARPQQRAIACDKQSCSLGHRGFPLNVLWARYLRRKDIRSKEEEYCRGFASTTKLIFLRRKETSIFLL